MHQFCHARVGRAPLRGATIVFLAPLISALLLVVSAVPVRAQTWTTFTAVLTSGQEPPPNTNASQAFGVALVVFNAVTGDLCFSISYDESLLTSAETDAHFHAPGQPGVNAPVVVPLPSPGSPKNGCVPTNLTEDQRLGLFQGLWYINIHTAMNPGGEIRGQVIPQVAPIF
jgi:CHRD domain-containing protein